MRLLLVHMPWGAINVPSLALGITQTVAARAGHEVSVRYANLDFVDWVHEQTDLRELFGAAQYEYYAAESYFQCAGDWVFSGALYEGEVRPGSDEHFLAQLADSGASPEQIAVTKALRAVAPRFVSWLADRLLADAPDLVGFTTTFQQNTASLAVARLLKRRAPETRVVFGGANCDGVQGAALHRNFPFLDYVVRGEGEAAFPQLLGALAEGREPSGIGGLCWRDGSGVSTANPMSHHPLPPAAMATPTFDGFFDRLAESVAATWIEPTLVVEGSRGCWWGEKHHCTFCGLNGSFMQFRSKPPAEFLAELLSLSARHQLLDFVVVDNIMEMGYLDSVLRPLAESGYQLRLHFEIKSNLRRHQFQQLADAGVVQVQPGVENLSTHVLRLMDKGVSGCQNVRALRDAQSAGVTTSWNYLYGFPGESEEDYTSILEQLSMLHHLDPPLGANRIVLERFSPYFDRPELGFADRRPAPQYQDLYRLPDEELADLAYFFATPPRGIGEELAGRLAAALDEWTDRFPLSRLTFTDLTDRIVLVSERSEYDWTVLELTSPLHRTVFGLLDQPRTERSLVEQTGADLATVRALLAGWARLGLVFTDDGRYLQVAVEAHNQVLQRVAHRHSTARKRLHAVGD
ncbi:RiPP maturation radical SAM C-methyltransferase [Lentzea sp. NPDC004789]